MKVEGLQVVECSVSVFSVSVRWGAPFWYRAPRPFNLASSRMPGLPDVDLKTGKFDRVRLSKLFILSLIVRCIVAGQSDYQ